LVESEKEKELHMRRSLIVSLGSIAIAVATVAAPAARAQDGNLGLTEASFGGGVSIPFGDFSDAANAGFLITPRLAYYATPRFALGVEYAFHRYDAKTDFFDSDVTIHQFTALGKLLLSSSRSTPYMRAQLGLYNVGVSTTFAGFDVSGSENKFGFGAGFGGQFFGQAAVGGFVDGVFHLVFTDSTMYFLDLQAGVMLLFDVAR
jgi:hypothetical protein